MTAEAVEFIKRLVGAWDCCGTCAGGVLATRDARLIAEAEARGERLGGEAERERIAAAIERCCKARVENNDQRLNFSKGATAAYTHAARIARGDS